MKLRKRYRINFKFKLNIKSLKFIIFLFIMIIISVIFLLNYLNKKLTPTLLTYAEVEIKRISGIIINNAIRNYVNDSEVDNLYLITKNNNGAIMTIDFDPLTLNRILTKVTYDIQRDLKEIINGNLPNIDSIKTDTNTFSKIKDGIVFEVPTGVALKNSLLSNLGPRIPVRLNLIGEVVSNINTKVTNYGINNAIMEVGVNIKLTEQVILPFKTKDIVFEIEVPLSVKLIQGTVPNYYFNGIDKNSPNLAIPIE